MKELEADPAIPLVRKLVWRFRAGAIIKSLNVLSEFLRIGCGDTGLEELLDRYFDVSEPSLFASDEAMNFMSYVRSQNLTIPYLDDVILFETCKLRTVLESRAQEGIFAHDPRDILAALEQGTLPERLPVGRFKVEVVP